MKTTLEIPDAIFRQAKSVAAERGIPLRELVTEAVKEKLAHNRGPSDQPWMTASANSDVCARKRQESIALSKGNSSTLKLRTGCDFGH
jgi:hypothetical protein